MAKAIPLSDPYGTVYAYACGVCHHIGSSAESLAPHEADDIAHFADMSKARAERCCRCERCDVVKGMSEVLGPNVCEACLPAYEAEKATRDAECELRDARARAIQTDRIQAAKDADAASRLCALMRDISEDCYCAGWLHDLEFSLWPMLSGGDRSFGMDGVTEEQVAELRRLHEKCGGWWRWEEDVGEVFVPTAEWEQIYDASNRRAAANEE